MYNGFVHLHNVLRWVILILLLIALFRHFTGMTGRKPYTKTDRKTDLFLMISVQIQFLIGLYEWFVGPLGYHLLKATGFSAAMKDPAARFWIIEHNVGMIIAIALISIGKGVGKKNISDTGKHRKIFWYFLIALLVILVSIPWPFRANIGRPWFPGM